MRARSLLLGASVTMVVASACGNDFDALFEGAAAPDAGPATDGGGGADGRVSNDPTETCGARAATCGPDDRCEDTTCSHTCSGCGCACSSYTCPSSDGIKSCTADCNGGSTCEVTCDVTTCNLQAHGSTAIFRCEEDAKTGCTVVCDRGALCKVSCENEGPCDVTCNGATCSLSCSSNTSSCTLDCVGRPGATCPDGTKICGDPKECP